MTEGTPTSTNVESSRRTHPTEPLHDWQRERWDCSRSMLLIPSLPNRMPADVRPWDGLLVELGLTGCTCHVYSSSQPPPGEWVVGVEARQLEFHYTVAQNLDWERLASDRWCGRFQFAATAMNWLMPIHLRPRLDGQGRRFRLDMAPDVAAAWQNLGIIKPVVVQRIYACPECGSIPVFGTGCRHCGGQQIEQPRLIHHFRCAFVDYASRFRHDAGELSCPKCHASNLVVGVDYENLMGPPRCWECGHRGSILEPIGTCLSCGLLFPQRDAHDEEIIGFDVQRLDPLAVLAES